MVTLKGIVEGVNLEHILIASRPQCGSTGVSCKDAVHCCPNFVRGSLFAVFVVVVVVVVRQQRRVRVRSGGRANPRSQLNIYELPKACPLK